MRKIGNKTRRIYCAAVLLLAGLAAGPAAVRAEQNGRETLEDFEIPGMTEEIDALLSGDLQQLYAENLQQEPLEELKKEQLYRLLEKDAALAPNVGDVPESRYDPREKNLVTAVRDQRSNTCWAFSSLAAGEESLVYKGAADASTLDLSEAHLTYFFYHPAADPLGNTAGDGNHNTSLLNFMGVGSNTIFSTFALANWVGAAEESLMPFENLNAGSSYADTLAFQDAAHLQNAYWINFGDVDAPNVVKRMIKTYGAAAVNFYYGDAYYNSNTCAYYAPLDASRANNHSVTIVGWDDHYSRENFREDCRPANDGAWIVKNSYGSGWGEEGFFYLSYEDSTVNSANTSRNRARAYVFDFEPADNYDYNYQYDGSAGAYNATNSSEITRVDSGSSVANVYQVYSPGKQSTETLKAVSFALYDVAVSYRIQIYKNLTDPNDPCSGTPQLAEAVEGSTSYAGYYTVPLEQEVTLYGGENFSVVITLSKESGGEVNYFVDKTYQNGSWVSFVNAVEEGQSFRYADGGWEDLAGYGATVRIKAFTDADTSAVRRVSIVPEGMELEEDGVYRLSLYAGEIYSAQLSFYPADDSPGGILWTSDHPETATVDANGTVTGVGSGSAVITAALMDGSGLSVSFRVTVKQNVREIALSSGGLNLVKGEAALLTAVVSPEEAVDKTVLWESSDVSVASVDETGCVEAFKEGVAVITARSSANPLVKAECRVTVKDAERDDVDETGTEIKIKDGGASDGNSGASAGNSDVSAEAVGASKVKAAERADTSDRSAGKAVFWLLVFLAGIVIMNGSLTRDNSSGVKTSGKLVRKIGIGAVLWKISGCDTIYSVCKNAQRQENRRRKKHEEEKNSNCAGT